MIHIAAGYPLIQDIHHPGNHKIKTYDGKELITISLHHQMADISNINKDKVKILAWTENISPIHENGEGEEVVMEVEPEIIYYPEMKAISWQGHPEMQNIDSPMVVYCQNLIDNLLENKL